MKLLVPKMDVRIELADFPIEWEVTAKDETHQGKRVITLKANRINGRSTGVEVPFEDDIETSFRTALSKLYDQVIDIENDIQRNLKIQNIIDKINEGVF